ncbi:MAG: endonuclease III domain-containing protein [Chloroflexi bacterium]|nr:endonuclease III domain-containing protein [Chloroflexota bacterium]
MPALREIMEVYGRLFAAYGPQHWWPGESPFEVIVGAILTQNTAWGNVERAIANLKAAGALSALELRSRPVGELAALIRPAGYFNSKARKLRAFAEHLGKYSDNLERFFSSKPLPELRGELLGIYGIGPETADSILLYAGGLPSFVVDAYTNRVLARLGWLPEGGAYHTVQEAFHRALPRDPKLFNEFHALLVVHGKTACRKSAPACPGCPLLDLCAHGITAVSRAK